jgi:hypothetical protein
MEWIQRADSKRGSGVEHVDEDSSPFPSGPVLNLHRALECVTRSQYTKQGDIRPLRVRVACSQDHARSTQKCHRPHCSRDD